MGGVLKLHREWQLSGDVAMLRQLWPAARRSLDYAWQHWDPDRDGVMEGEQHNTYDVEFYGPNTMTGLLYLGALRAAEEMARALGDATRADEYRRVCESGRSRIERELWNGAFYVQNVRMPAPDELETKSERWHTSGIRPGEPEPRYQYGPGCLSDQLLGQWFASVVGLGHLVDPERVRVALGSIHNHNFRPDLSTHESCQRTYALNGEGGLLACSWPNGGRPRYPFPYADEVWTGIEYQVAAHLIYEGLVDEGLTIVDAVRARYDGIRRNPWDEFECGHHYARALASWSLLLAASGYHYRAPEQHLEFAARVNPDDFRCFFSVGSGWGRFQQRREGNQFSASLRLREGTLELRTLRVELPAGGIIQTASASLGDVAVPISPVVAGSSLTVTFRDGVLLMPSAELLVRLT
jgi:uncharacterized protein (DUF608 family)